MSKQVRTGLVALMAVVLLAAPAAAQEKLAAGTWTGTVLTPDDQLYEMEYEVWYDEEALAIELIPPAEVGGSIVADNVALATDALTFSIQVGETIACSLLLHDDGHYEGDCVDSSGGAALMSMFPPADGRR